MLLVVILLAVFGLVRYAVATGIDLGSTALGPKPTTTYTPDPANPPSATVDNPLLTDANATLVPASCKYASWGTEVAKARAFFESAASCLSTAWKPIFAENNLSFEEPKLNISATTAGISTPCTGSTSNFAAFYCAANKTIYMPISQLQTDIFRDNWVVYLSVFAHEYGHHVQAQSGILRKANSERVDVGARSPQGLELSRRVELQANCFDGMYIVSSKGGGSLSSSQVQLATKDAYGRGDSTGDMRDHGTAQNGGKWFESGVSNNRTTSCNTFAASAAEVS
ncbi:peptidase [Nocardia camponoti]|uniref:Peptidase n=1 Tax=Nocardia camponoti TaxID=1616106 RepID=A0A917QP78_9NOCA|nr:peptidase [Nocardia camponoti]